jgi:NTP pyrophosphatase (non-canonical NTP hydrolase)
MKISDYPTLAMRTAVYPKEHSLSYPILGLISELTELHDKASQTTPKYVQHNTLIRDNIRAELGDVYWYMAAICVHFNWKFEELIDPAHMSNTGYNANFYLPDNYLLVHIGDLAGKAKKLLRGDYTGTSGAEDYIWRSLKAIHTILLEWMLYLCIDEDLPEAPRDLFPEPSVWLTRDYALIYATLLENIAKLSQRLDRGTIQGDGDNR